MNPLSQQPKPAKEMQQLLLEGKTIQTEKEKDMERERERESTNRENTTNNGTNICDEVRKEFWIFCY